jgi:anthranilate synthase component 1
MTAWVEERLDHVPDLEALGRAFPTRFPYLLESSAHGPLGQHSLLLYAGDEALVCQDSDRAEFFDRLDRDWRAARIEATDCAIPFVGGWFVYLGYEMAAGVEPCLDLPPNRTGLPDAIAHRCPAAVIVDHSRQQALLVAENSDILDAVLGCVRSARVGTAEQALALPALESLEEEDARRYEQAVGRIQDYLAAGDVFQVNVSRQWRGQFAHEPSPWALYDALMTANPAPFAGLMRWGSRVLLSSSPERLVQTIGDCVQTRPIAGTRPRGRTDDRDQALSQELISNLKERAEHVMLIDLERNDLGRVCRPGSIEVNELMVVESYAHVHHIVSNVRGLLMPGASPVDALRAVFPGGTITGCPKVRCMEIIAELEQEGRGFYTGSMGYLGRDGRMDMNILIRSMLLDGRAFRFRTGAGIVVDSDPHREVLETADKARGMLLALQGGAMEKRYA